MKPRRVAISLRCSSFITIPRPSRRRPVRSASRNIDFAATTSGMPANPARAASGSPSLRCHGGQEFVVDERLQRVAECVLSIDGLREPGLAQLDGADKGAGSFRCAVGECKIRVLVPVTDQLTQAQWAKTVL